MNAAVLMMTACLAGADPAPAAAPPAGPVVVYPGQSAQGNGCGHATVDCCDKDKCCLLSKIKEKICCFKLCCDKGPSCDKGPVCHKPCAPACPPKPACHNPCPPKPVCHNPCPPKPVCHNPCPPQPACHQPCPPKPACHQPFPPKPACHQPCAPACPPQHGHKSCFSCEKPACAKVEPVCHDHASKPCWTPGYCLHKCKEKLCGLCDKGNTCHGGCGTACTPCASGSSTVAPGYPAPAVAPTPVNPAPKAMPDVKKIGSAYPMVRPELAPASGTAPRVIDLTPGPF